MNNEELIQYLSKIKGVGQWTVEMILMFTLGREDVFALDDLGIQQSIARLYNLDVTDKKALKEKCSYSQKNGALIARMPAVIYGDGKTTSPKTDKLLKFNHRNYFF
jgi:endonuclease III-like uncharacterized protein